MRTNKYTCVLLASAAFLTANAQSNKSLSNLTAPTAINQSLLPNTDNGKDLGSATFGWHDLYLTNRLYLKDSIAVHARGEGNFFAGLSAGNGTLTGTYNAALGTNALRSLTTGIYNTAAGYNALAKTTSGGSNNAFGYQALNRNTTGRDNTAIGYIALEYNTTGYYNTGSGSWALRSNTTGSNNTANGYSALWSNTTGNDNTAVGKYAMYSNTTGNSNIAIGTSALYKNKIGYNLIAIGDSALYNFIYSTDLPFLSSNMAIGSKALYQNQTGLLNTALGHEALKGNTTGTHNTAAGRGALLGNNGSYNTAVGANALLWTKTGSYNTFIGAEAGPTLFREFSNSTAIGYYADVYQSDQVHIGNPWVTSIGGQVGWTTFSDGRYKKEIKENIPGLAFINKLRPVSYKVDIKGLDEHLHKAGSKSAEQKNEKVKAYFDKSTDLAANMVQDGFVAQEVEEAASKLGFEFNGVDKPKEKDGLYGLRYDNFVVPLVKAVQELSKKNDSLQQQINELKAAIPVQANTISAVTSTILTGAALEQNVPNPFAGTTAIRYTLPQKFSAAQIIITDNNGKTIKQVTITGQRQGIVYLDAATLSAGIYNYSLIVDGRISSSKQMVLSK